MQESEITTNFRHRDFLDNHIRSCMNFYHPRCIDPNGGFFQYFRDDGSIYDHSHRHLVSSTRFIFNYAMAGKHFGNEDYRQAAIHGAEFLRKHHRHQQHGGYAWFLDGGKVVDGTNHCYGLAFVLLAYAKLSLIEQQTAFAWIDECHGLMQKQFWSKDQGLYADEASADWQTPSAYRGQNSNMHACEALLAAYEATGQSCFLEQSLRIARTVTRVLAAQTDGLIWEHYDRQWRVDWQYNHDKPRDLFRPWGFQPGHQAEWAKLLLQLRRHIPEDWMLKRARQLYHWTLETAWDRENGGFFYGIAPDGTVCDHDKYYWVQAETLVTAALLAEASGEQCYWSDYDRIWDYVWHAFVDHQHGAWYRILDRQNLRYSDEKSPAGKTDYHTMAACYDILAIIDRIGEGR